MAVAAAMGATAPTYLAFINILSIFVATGAMPRLAGSPGVDQKFYPISSWTSFICSTMSYQFLLLIYFPFFYYYGLEYFEKISFEIPKG